MAKNFFNGFVLLRRSYAVVSGNVKENSTASLINKAAEMSNNVGLITKPKAVQKDEFWIRNPKTGNWMPENHFEEIDAVDIRAEIFSKNNKFGIKTRST